MKNVKLLSFLVLVGLLAVSCSTMSNYKALDTKSLSFDEAVKVLDTPEKINVWMLRNLGWKIRRGHRYSPEKLYEKRVGSCIDWSMFAACILDRHGYETEVIYGRYASPPSGALTFGHAVAAYKKNGKWYVAGDSRGRLGAPGSFGVGAGPFDNFTQIAAHATMPYGLRDYVVLHYLTFERSRLMKRYEDVKLNWPK